MAALISPGFAGSERQQIAVQTDDGLHIGAGARELQDIAAAETEADRSLAFEIADLSFRALAAQRVERGSDAQPPFGRIGTQCIGKGHGFRRAGGNFAAAIHVGDESDIFAAGHGGRALDGVVAHAHPVRRHE